MRLDVVVGGAPQALTTITDIGRGGTWNADGVILFSPTPSGPLFRVSASGGETTVATKLDRQTSHRFPFFLPDGRQFLFYAQGTPDTGGIHLGSLDSDAVTRLTDADTAGVYLTSLSAGSSGPVSLGGWLLWVRTGTLVAQRLDLNDRRSRASRLCPSGRRR